LTDSTRRPNRGGTKSSSPPPVLRHDVEGSGNRSAQRGTWPAAARDGTGKRSRDVLGGPQDQGATRRPRGAQVRRAVSGTFTRQGDQTGRGRCTRGNRIYCSSWLASLTWAERVCIRPPRQKTLNRLGDWRSRAPDGAKRGRGNDAAGYRPERWPPPSCSTGGFIVKEPFKLRGRIRTDDRAKITGDCVERLFRIFVHALKQLRLGTSNLRAGSFGQRHTSSGARLRGLRGNIGDYSDLRCLRTHDCVSRKLPNSSYERRDAGKNSSGYAKGRRRAITVIATCANQTGRRFTTHPIPPGRHLNACSTSSPLDKRPPVSIRSRPIRSISKLAGNEFNLP